MSLGTALGAATGNIGMYMPIGLSVGMCLGLTVGSAVKNNDDGNYQRTLPMRFELADQIFLFL